MLTELDTLIQAYADWLLKEVQQGLDPYYINIMFHPLYGSSHSALLAQMQNAIYHCFFPTLCRQFARHPHRKSQEHLLPRARLFADLPVWKRSKQTNSG